MIGYFVIGVGILLVLVAIGQGFSRADPRQLARAVKWLGIVMIALGCAFLLFTGRLGYAIALATLVLPLAMQLLRAWRQGKTFARMGGLGSGQQSTVATDWLRMSLDHTSNDVDGEILQGTFAGRWLNELGQPDLLTVWREAAVDRQALRLLEAYLDRRFPDWRDSTAGDSDQAGDQAGDQSGEQSEEQSGEQTGEQPGQRTGGQDGDRAKDRGSATSAMTVDDACRVLGVARGAGEGEIRAAHQRLIRAVHPDRGGSDYLAAQINRARDILLATAKQR